MLISDITQRLHILTTILSDSEAINDNLVFAVADFVRQYGDTNALLDEVERLLSTNQSELQTQLLSLISAINEYNAVEKPELRHDEFKAVVAEHLRRFKEPQQAAQQRATELWQRYQALSNRLDYLPLDSDEYRQLDAECDAAKADYDQAHAENSLLYNRYRQEETKWAYASFFNPQFLSILISNLREICEAVRTEIIGGKEDE